MVQAVHIASNDAALIRARSALISPGRDCEGRNENTPTFQERIFSRGLFNDVEGDASTLLLLAQCMP
jgi:hypothetical protein